MLYFNIIENHSRNKYLDGKIIILKFEDRSVNNFKKKKEEIDLLDSGVENKRKIIKLKYKKFFTE